MAPYPASRLGRRNLGDDEPGAYSARAAVVQATETPMRRKLIYALICKILRVLKI